jgi:hypothetical protein
MRVLAEEGERADEEVVLFIGDSVGKKCQSGDRAGLGLFKSKSPLFSIVFHVLL